jgi:hypothetical protein
MATTLSGPSRLSHLVDAVTLGYSAGAVIVLVLAHTSAGAAIGVIFAAPLILAAVVRILRGLHFALTGRELRISARGQIQGPPARLGRPSWERPPNASSSRRRRY